MTARGDCPPPTVFTLGSSAAEVARPFCEHSVTAAKRLGRRAVIIVGKNTGHRPIDLPDGVIACDYAPFSELFPRAAVIVHAGGIGTTGLAMRSGRPMLVVPYVHDQFDNAARVARGRIARTIFSAPVYSDSRRGRVAPVTRQSHVRAADIGDRGEASARGRSKVRV